MISTFHKNREYQCIYKNDFLIYMSTEMFIQEGFSFFLPLRWVVKDDVLLQNTLQE